MSFIKSLIDGITKIKVHCITNGNDNNSEKLYSHVVKAQSQKYFVICRLCFWSTYYTDYKGKRPSNNNIVTDTNSKIIMSCPICKNDWIELLPVDDY